MQYRPGMGPEASSMHEESVTMIARKCNDKKEVQAFLVKDLKVKLLV